MIENPGVAPVEGFTILGASTKDEKSDVIGMYGSGNKHGVATCLRNNYDVVVFCGDTKLTFTTKSQRIGDKDFARVVVNI